MHIISVTPPLSEFPPNLVPSPPPYSFQIGDLLKISPARAGPSISIGTGAELIPHLNWGQPLTAPPSPWKLFTLPAQMSRTYREETPQPSCRHRAAPDPINSVDDLQPPTVPGSTSKRHQPTGQRKAPSLERAPAYLTRHRPGVACYSDPQCSGVLQL